MKRNTYYMDEVVTTEKVDVKYFKRLLARIVPYKKLFLLAFILLACSSLIALLPPFLIRAIVLQLGMDANDMKLISAVIVALALCIPVVWEKYQLRRAYARSAKAAPATPAANSEGGR